MAQKRPRCKLESCGVQFRQKRSDQVYCSPTHRKAAGRLRKAEEAENGRPTAESNGHDQPDYTTLAQATEPSTDKGKDEDEGMTDEEFMAEWMRVNMPDGPPPRQPAAPVAQDDAGIHVTISNIPTRFPGTPLSRGRQ